MTATLHQLAAGLYLAAALLAWAGLALRSGRLERGAVGVLAAGAVAHVAALGALHGADPQPPLTDPFKIRGPKSPRGRGCPQ